MNEKTLRQWRRERDMTQENLAKLAGVSARSIASWEDSNKNFRNASYRNVRAVAGALEIKVADFDFNLESTSKILN